MARPKIFNNDADRQRAAAAAAVDITLPACVNPQRRGRCAKSLALFAKTYCTDCEGGLLIDAPPKSMYPILEAMQSAVTSGGRFHIRMPRGHGKSCFCKIAIAWAIAYGHKKFIVAVSCKAADASSMIDDIWNLFERSPTLYEDFPEICAPIRALDGKYQRAKSISVKGERCELKKNASRIQMPKVKDADGAPFPASGAIIDCVGITGSARGKVVGSTRPDFLFIDDPQTDEEARNEERVREKERLIERNFMGLAGHKKAISVLMTSTPIEADDLSDTFAAKRDWRTLTFKMLEKLPACLGKRGNLWEQYAEVLYHETTAEREAWIACGEFYRKHRREMDAGAQVLNANNYDPSKEVSAIQHAMNLRITLGVDNFNSEYQMITKRAADTFRITARLIVSRIRNGAPSGFIPADTVLTVAATDLNPSYGFSTAVVCFNRDMAGFVTAYHVMKTDVHDSGNKTENARRVYNALVKCGRELAALGIKFDAWGIDGSGTYFDTAHKFAREAEPLVGMTPTILTGRAGVAWNPTVKTRVKEAFNDTVECGDRDNDGNRRRWLFFNADAWKENAQTAWRQEVGAPGGLTLFDGGVLHDGPRGFATQIANEYLVGKSTQGARTVYRWRTKEPHDFGDCMAMAFALAASKGFTIAGQFAPKGRGRVKIGGLSDTKTAKSVENVSTSAEISPSPDTPTAVSKPKIKIGGVRH